jgi:AhpD family alkylhydroperoxidase
MKTINVPTREQVSPESQALFDQIVKRMGKLPNLYATMGYSASTLKAFLEFDGAFNNSVFSAKEKEAIFLVVSEVNNCNYCLAAHTMIGKMKGFSVAETMTIRKGHIADKKLNAVLELTQSITENKGEAAEGLLEAFFDAGYHEEALIELIGLITAKIFTNYVFALAKVPIDFPEAEPLS